MRWGLLMSSRVEPLMVMVGFLWSKSGLRQIQGRGLGVEPPPEHSRLSGCGLLSFLFHALSFLLLEYIGAPCLGVFMLACLPGLFVQLAQYLLPHLLSHCSDVTFQKPFLCSCPLKPPGHLRLLIPASHFSTTIITIAIMHSLLSKMSFKKNENDVKV